MKIDVFFWKILITQLSFDAASLGTSVNIAAWTVYNPVWVCLHSNLL